MHLLHQLDKNYMKSTMNQRILARILVSLVVVGILYSCGFRGPLYMPKKQNASGPQKTVASKPANTVMTPAVVNPVSK